MFFEERNLEDKIENNEKKIKGLEQLVKTLDNDVKGLFEQIRLSPDEIHQFISNRENFSSEEWQKLESERQKADENLKRELDSLTDPRAVAKAMNSTKEVQRHWVPVR